MVKLRKEEKLLLALLKPDKRKHGGEKRLPAGGVDWDEFYEILRDRDVLAPLYGRISALGADSGFLSKCRDYLYESVTKNAFFEKDLIAIIKLLKESGITAIPLKGPVLNRLLYGDMELRGACCDLDFLIKREDLDKAAESLRRLGYRHRENTEEEAYRRIHSNQIGLSTQNTSLSARYIELHYGLFNPDELITDFDAERFMQNPQAMAFGDADGVEVLCPNNENLLIFLVLHIIATKSFNTLRYFCDIHRLVTHYRDTINWQGLADTLKRFHLEGFFYAVMRVTKYFFGTEIPESFRKASSPGLIKKILSAFLIRKKDVLRGVLPSEYGQLFLYRYIFIKEYFLSRGMIDFIGRLSKIVFISAGEYGLRRNYPPSAKLRLLALLRLLNPLLALLGIKKRI